jgi:cyclic pyranopterin phosphate synthase
MPEKYAGWVPREEILTYEEILNVVRVGTSLGFCHFRVTGGEPLIRPGVAEFLWRLTRVPGVQSVSLSTNGTRLPVLARPLWEAGLRRVNVSLDALDPVRYRAITRGDLAPVLEGIETCQALGFSPLKLNTVLLRNQNEDQIWPLVEFAAQRGLVVRFIELMPLTRRDVLDPERFFSVQEARRILEERDVLEPLDQHLGLGPAKYYRLVGCGAVVGFIGAISDEKFCEGCNKMRLTADGKLRACLGNHLEWDLKPYLRPLLQEGALRKCWEEALAAKPLEHSFRDGYLPGRVMTAIGG